MDQRLIEVYSGAMRSSQMQGSASGAGRPLGKDEIAKQIEVCTSRIEICQKGYDQAIAMYGGVFGMPPEINTNVGEAAIRAAEKDFCDTNLQKLLFQSQRGFLARKPKPADYYRFSNSAKLLIYVYTERRRWLYQQVDVLNETIDDIQESLKKAKANITRDPDAWSSYPCTDNFSQEIYIGDLEVPVEPRAVAHLQQLNIVENDNESAWLHLPFSYHTGKPFSALFSYAGSAKEGEEKLGNMIRSMMYQIIRAMPPYTYEFVYLDPTRSGATLREIQAELSKVVDGNAYQLHDKLYPDSVYRMLTVAGSKEQVREELKKLEARVATINSICGGTTVAQFNASQLDENGQILEGNVGVIPQVFVFFENVHGEGILDKSAMEILQKLADCAGSTGISLVVTSVREKGQSLTDEERMLLKDDQIRDDLDHIEILPEGCSLYVDASAMGESSANNLFFNFKPWFEDICHPEFLKLVSAGFRPSLEKETTYDKRVDLDAVWGTSVGNDEIRIPVGVNLQDKLVYLELGNPASAHGLLAGSTGCGKSSFLHTIINGVIAHYKPTDVQLWLSDYKTAEFRRYMKNTPPHVAYVGIDRSLEYTMSFIDRLHGEYERRLQVFDTCTSVPEYRELHGPDSMPRILVLVDEFHVMSNHVKDFPEYKMKLTALLREARALGMTFLLADQTCGVGLQGLPEDGKLQLTCRMAMRTVYDEYNAVFNISNAKDVIPTQDKFEVTLQRTSTHIDSLGKQVVKTYYERTKTLYANPDLRSEIAQRSIASYGPAVNPVFVEAAERKAADWDDIAAEEKRMPAQRGITMWMGKPLTLKKYFEFRLMANYGENVVTVAPREEVLSSLFITQLENIRRQGDYEIYVIADENDSQFCMCENWLQTEAMWDPHIHIVTFIGDICDTIMQLRESMIKRRRMRSYGRIAIFWMGLYDITREMSYLPSNRPDGKKTSTVSKSESVDDLNAQFAALFGDAPDLLGTEQDDEPEYEEEEVGYNAAEDISELLGEGPKRSIHSFCYYTSANIALKTKCAPLGGTKASFNHKIAMSIGKEESLDYFGATKLSVDAEGKPLDDKTAVYYNGRVGTQFMPFISEVEAQNDVR